MIRSNIKSKISKVIILSCALPALSLAQDTLKFRNGTQLVGKIIEITPKVVIYKKFENIDGPLYSDLKNDIEYVILKNGQKELFEIEKTEIVPESVFAPKRPEIRTLGTKYMYKNNLIGNREMYDVLLSVNDKKITNYIVMAKQQKAWQYIGFAAIPTGITALYFLGRSFQYSRYESNGKVQDQTNATILGLLGAACFTTSITLKVQRTRNEKAALRLYNQVF